MNKKTDPEEVIGYLDEEGCLIPIKNFTGPNALFHGQPVPETWHEIREKDLDDPSFGWEVTI